MLNETRPLFLCIFFILSFFTQGQHRQHKEISKKWITNTNENKICGHRHVSCLYKTIGTEDEFYEMFDTISDGTLVGPLKIDYWLEEQYDINGFIEMKPVSGICYLRKIKEHTDSVFYEMSVRHILAEKIEYGKDTLQAFNKAMQLYERIKNSGSILDTFKYCARTYGKDGTSKVEGDLGWFEQGYMIPQFEQACLKGNKGDLFFVKTSFGYHIVYIQEDKRAIYRPILHTIFVKVYYVDNTIKCENCL